MAGVTISSGYGAGGSVVAPALADRLGVALIDRAINSKVAEELDVTVDEAQDGEVRRDFLETLMSGLAPAAGLGFVPDVVLGVRDGRPGQTAAAFRTHTERLLVEAVARGAVVLGRAGAAALLHDPDVLRVRLYGPVEGRVRQGARIEAISETEAARRLPRVDRARARYVHRLYGRDIDDPALYHLQLDSTALHADDCVALIADAYRRLLADRNRSAPD